MASDQKGANLPTLEIIPDIPSHTFTPPVKKINEGEDVTHFLNSKAYGDITLFILQLNRSLFPSILQDNASTITKAWEIGSPNVRYADAISNLQRLIAELRAMIESAPPDPGPRRFGNVAFRQWHELATAGAPGLLLRCLPRIPQSAHVELLSYLLGSFGSAQRLDYGSGHELSFIAFLAGLWKLGCFDDSKLSTEEMSRAVALGVVQPYLELIRQLIVTYTLEPAGSHGVWGLDDHSFVPYIFGSAQLGKPILISQHPPLPTPTEGSLDGAPLQSDVTDASKSRRWAETNMYFSAITFIHDVKKGPFWEHSPMLYDISGVRAGWSKINKGMLKMYVAEVLSKFPVVQHFPFGSLFSLELDPAATEDQVRNYASGTKEAEHLKSHKASSSSSAPLRSLGLDDGTKAPWAAQKPIPAPPPGGTKAPWASATPAPPPVSETTKASWANMSRGPPQDGSATGRPNVATGSTVQRGLANPGKEVVEDTGKPMTRAPWAKQ